MTNVVFAIFDFAELPVTGLALSFTTYVNQDGTSVSPPPITEIGGGFYTFAPNFTSVNLAYAYAILTNYQPSIIYNFVRHEDFGIVGLPESPNQLMFGVFNDDDSPATGHTYSFATYENMSGFPIAPPSISELGGGFYSFIPEFDVINTAFAYTIDTSLQPSIVYGLIDASDFAPPSPTPPGPSPILLSSILRQREITLMNFGQDTYDLSDLPTLDIQVTGNLNIALRLARRLQTGYGTMNLINDDPDFGFDLSSLVNGRFGLNDIKNIKMRIEQECLKDEEVFDVTVDISTIDIGVYNIAIKVDSSLGPFTLTIPINQVTYKILFSNGTN